MVIFLFIWKELGACCDICFSAVVPVMWTECLRRGVGLFTCPLSLSDVSVLCVCVCVHALDAASVCPLSHVLHELYLTVNLPFEGFFPQWDSRCRFTADETGSVQ